MNELILICGSCRKPVAAGAGHLGVSLAEVRAYQSELREWQEAHGGQVVDLSVLLAMRDEIAWRSEHYACAEARGDNGDDSYEIDAGRMTTWAQLTSWTSHLMGKTWLPATDWDDLLREVSEGTSERIILAVRSAA